MKSIAFGSLMAFMLASTAWSEEPQIKPGYVLQFPRDHGSHEAYRTEWWYLTGWLDAADGVPRGFQVTFFRVRNTAADVNPSKFAPRQLLFAHAALSDPKEKHMLRAERSARMGFGLAEASQTDLNVHIDTWSLGGANTGQLTTRIATDDFSIDLQLLISQPPLLHGNNGFSIKDENAIAASYYYSLPQLQVTGSIVEKGRRLRVEGRAWFDHEWSNTYVDPHSVGWDWIGINLANGDAVMAFRTRDARANQRWSAGTWRSKTTDESYTATDLSWTPIRRWQSPTTGVSYPIAWRITIGTHVLVLRPLLDNQENDARGSVGILYWEGAVEALDENGRAVGQGYLELTGYGWPVRL